MVKSFPRTQSLCDRKGSQRSRTSGDGLRLTAEKIAESGQLDFGEQKGQIRGSLIGSDMVRREKNVAQ